MPPKKANLKADFSRFTTYKSERSSPRWEVMVESKMEVMVGPDLESNDRPDLGSNDRPRGGK